MRRSSKKRGRSEQLSVSLFPFLAVLICTLGVLIVLLVLAVKQADTEAHQRRDTANENAQARQTLLDEHAAEIEHLEDLLDLQETQIEGIAEVRPDALLRMQTAREHRAYIEESIRSTERDAQLLADEAKRLMNADTALVESNTDPSALDSLRNQIAAAIVERDKKRGESNQPTVTKYGIVPYRGLGGTLRRPIFVECTADKLILQPHGIEISKSDFAPPLETGNMLDAALLTIRNYFQKYKLVDDSEKPYPLLVVRPEGAETYGLARRAMKSWDDEFGYELVELDTPIDFGKPDPQLAAEVQSAVDEAKQRQRAIAARRAMRQANGRYGSSSGRGDERPGFRVSGTKGGFVAENGSFANSSSVSYANRDAEQERGENGESQNRQVGSFSSGDSASENSAQKASFQSAAKNPGSASTSQGNGGNSNAMSGSPDSLATERGSNWALPTQTPGATGYVRPVRVFCQTDRFVIFNGNNRPTSVMFQADSVTTVDELVNETWKLIETWGIAGSNAYWKPDLRVTVMPGAETQFRRFKSMLDQSGLGIEQVANE